MPPSAAYRNFDLLITRAGDRYRALVVDAPGGDADIFFDLPRCSMWRQWVFCWTRGHGPFVFVSSLDVYGGSEKKE